LEVDALNREKILTVLIAALISGAVCGFIFAGVWIVLNPVTYTERLVTLIVALILAAAGQQGATHLISRIKEFIEED